MIQQRERLVALDFVRVVAMLSVILLHASSGYLFFETRVSIGGLTLGYLLNQFVRYCVPLFVLLSGLSQELAFRGQSYGAFLRARLSKLLLPYLIWSLLYYLHGFSYFSARDLLEVLLWGRAAPQLYFVVALMQLYLLYIPLRCALRKRPLITLLFVFCLSFFVQLAVYLMPFDVFLLPGALRPYILRTFFPWLFCFALGIVLAQRKEVWQAFLTRHTLAFSVAMLLCGLIYIAQSAATGSYDLSVKPLLFLYVPLAFFAFYGMGSRCGRSALVTKGIAGLARHSMTVFFCHIFVLDFLRESYALEGSGGLLLLSVLTTAFSLLLALCIDWSLERIKAWILT